jgi:hypothetical protein
MWAIDTSIHAPTVLEFLQNLNSDFGWFQYIQRDKED